MFQHSFAGHAKPSDKQNGTMRLQGMHCKQPIKRRQEKKYLGVFIGGLRDDQWSLQGSGQPDSLYAAQTGRRLYREHCKSYQLALPQDRRREMWEQASIVFAGQIYCSYPPDSVIIQWPVHQITLGPVTPPCITFTALYVHLLSRVKNGGALNNCIKWM